MNDTIWVATLCSLCIWNFVFDHELQLFKLKFTVSETLLYSHIAIST